MKIPSVWIVCIVLALAGATTAFGKASGGKISATLFDGQGNKEVLAEAVHVPREPAPASQSAPAPVQPQTTITTIADGRGKTVHTIETRGDNSVTRDHKGTVVSSSTRNPDGSTTVRDGRGTVQMKTTAPAN